MNNLKVLLLAAATLVLSAAANAEVAYTTKTAHLRAGPARDYPVVAILETGLAVDVQGCMQDYSWCDVIAGEYRGWVYARNVEYSYQGTNVPVIDSGAAIGIGVVTFIIGSYWQDHYVGRSWYRQMQQWSNRPPRTATIPRPAEGAAHPGGTQRPAPVSRSLQLSPAGIDPRQPQTRSEGTQRPTPAYHPVQRPPSAGVNPQPVHREAQSGREQHPTPGLSQTPRPRE